MTVEISSVGGVSPESPVGRAVLGKAEGDEVEVEAPRGSWRATIVSIRRYVVESPCRERRSGGAARRAPRLRRSGFRLHALPPRAGPHAGRVRRGQSACGADVRRRGARLPRGQAGHAVRRPGREAAREAARAASAWRASDVYIANVLKCRPPGQPRPAARRDRGVREPPLPPDRADRADRRRDARQLRDEAPLGPAARDHEGARAGAADDDRRPQRPALSALPPGGGALHAGDAEGARVRLRAAAGAARARGASRPRRRSPSRS